MFFIFSFFCVLVIRPNYVIWPLDGTCKQGHAILFMITRRESLVETKMAINEVRKEQWCRLKISPVDSSQNALYPLGVVHLYQFQDDRDTVLCFRFTRICGVEIHTPRWKVFTIQGPDETAVHCTLCAAARWATAVVVGLKETENWSWRPAVGKCVGTGINIWQTENCRGT
jgi:hypothetical protein